MTARHIRARIISESELYEETCFWRVLIYPLIGSAEAS